MYQWQNINNMYLRRDLDGGGGGILTETLRLFFPSLNSSCSSGSECGSAREIHLARFDDLCLNFSDSPFYQLD